MSATSLTRRDIRSGGRSGFAPIIIAIGIVSLLAGMSLVNSLSAGMVSKRQMAKINRVEAFYTTEISAWHAYLRNAAGLSVAEVGFDTSPYENTGIAEDQYSKVVGHPTIDPPI